MKKQQKDLMGPQFPDLSLRVLGKTTPSFFWLSFYYFINIFSLCPLLLTLLLWKRYSPEINLLCDFFPCISLCSNSMILLFSVPSSSLQRFPGEKLLGCPLQWSLFPDCRMETNVCVFCHFSTCCKPQKLKKPHLGTQEMQSTRLSLGVQHPSEFYDPLKMVTHRLFLFFPSLSLLTSWEVSITTEISVHLFLRPISPWITSLQQLILFSTRNGFASTWLFIHLPSLCSSR